MKSLADRLIRTAACSSGFLEKESRDEVARFILSQQNPDGGFRGRDSESDLYYSVFAAAGLRALGRPFPAWWLWKYSRSFGLGAELDFVHLCCLIQLRSAFPMVGKTRQKLFQTLDKCRAESAYDSFLKMLASDRLKVARFPSAPRSILLTDPTPSLAASVFVNRMNEPAVAKALLNRSCRSGGFSATEQLNVPDLLSTATALFALKYLMADLDSIRRPCLEFVESLWQDSGGFVGHQSDGFADVEYTFYALLSIGCLMQE